MGLSFKSLLPALDRSWERVRSVCASSDCPGQSLLRCIPQTRVGIRVGSLWYCGADCFATDVRTYLAELASRRVAEMPRASRRPLGLLLLAKGYMTEDQLRAVAAECQWNGEDIDSALSRLELVTEKQLAVARAAQWGCPVFAREHMGRTVEVDLPSALFEACEAVPLHASPERLVLGFVRRVDHGLLEVIERMTGRRPEPCILSGTDYAEQMSRITFVPGYEENAVEDSLSPERMARTMGRHAVRVAATRVDFARFRRLIWARIAGKRGIIDVVFRIDSATLLDAPRRVEELEFSTAIAG